MNGKNSGNVTRNGCDYGLSEKKSNGILNRPILNGPVDMDGTRADSRRTRKLVLSGMIFALALILAVVENALPSLPLPGVKFGLSNIAVMYALFFLSKSQAYSIAVLKGLFVFMTRGYIAGILSLSKGYYLFDDHTVSDRIVQRQVSYTVISISEPNSNIGQFTAVSRLSTPACQSWKYLHICRSLLVSGHLRGTSLPP